MIEKIEYIKEIGKFHNYQASGVVSFSELTLFYAENGTGKTTIARIFKSLTDNKAELLLTRKSIGATAAQSAQICSKDSHGARVHHTFNPSSGWNNGLPDLEIFDIHFINDNVYSGFDFSEDHKKKLHQFVIGTQGVAIQQQIEKNKSDKALSRQKLDLLESQLIQAVSNGFTDQMITGYLTTSNVIHANASQEIQAAEAELTTANANTTIRSLQNPVAIGIFNSTFDYSTQLANLAINTHSIGNAVLKQLYIDHSTDLRTHGIANPDLWLAQGYQYADLKIKAATETNCPFCQQKIDNTSQFFEAYVQKFNKAFSDFVTDLNTGLGALQQMNVDAFFQSLNQRIQTNVAALASWSIHLTSISQPQSPIINEADFRKKYADALNDFNEKIKNPSVSIPTTNLQAFKQIVDSTNIAIASYNQEVALYATAIGTFKISIQTVDTAQQKLNVIRRKHLRSNVTINSLCTQIASERSTLRTLTAAYQPLIQAQETAVTTFIGNYGTQINQYLNDFGTPYQITNIANISPQGKAIGSKLGFTLTINGVPISSDISVNANHRDTLSEGDKSAIAFAFFLSKLDIDPLLANKIVIFDDPLSSFDRNRKNSTIRYLRGLVARTKQVVVLSHNEHFIHTLSTTAIPVAKKRTLLIWHNPGSNSSEIKELDIEKMVESDYFQNLRILNDFLQSPDLSKKEHVLMLIRNVLESCIKFKFHRQLGSATNGTFGELIRQCTNASIPFRDTNSASVLGLLTSLNEVSWRSHHGGTQPTYANSLDPTTITISELTKCVTDTLDLIDNKL